MLRLPLAKRKFDAGSLKSLRAHRQKQIARTKGHRGTRALVTLHQAQKPREKGKRKLCQLTYLLSKGFRVNYF